MTAKANKLLRAIALKETELAQLKAAKAAKIQGYHVLSAWHGRNAHHIRSQCKELLDF